MLIDMTLTKRDLEIITHLRNNARKKITTIAEETNIPVTTIYDKVRVQGKRYVTKHTSLLNFPALGLLAHAHLAMRVSPSVREKLYTYLMESPNVNSLYRTHFGTDYLAECVFHNAALLLQFTENLERNFRLEDLRVYHVIDTCKKEDFLSKPEHASLLL